MIIKAVVASSEVQSQRLYTAKKEQHVKTSASTSKSKLGTFGRESEILITQPYVKRAEKLAFSR
jgi:hypothetical protein